MKMKHKIVMSTVAIWVTITAVCAYIYVVIGATWQSIAAEYETRWDYRVGFFALTFFPILLIILILTLWLEYRYLLKSP